MLKSPKMVVGNVETVFKSSLNLQKREERGGLKVNKETQYFQVLLEEKQLSIKM